MTTTGLLEIRDDDTIPTRPDGLHYPYVMTSPDQTAFADTITDLVGLLIPGYSNIPHTDEGADQALVARWEQAVVTATVVQTDLCLSALEAGTFDPADCDEDTLTALLGDKEVPVPIDYWPEDRVPLVLITTDYAPFVPHRTPPAGNVLWVDPADEASYLRSLTNLGVISFHTHQDA